ncbi:MAG: AtpZ/AtpI family protein [Candidatus Margulisbacteria bacterium]|jgi:ATP synthase protein I|nr:AtpZ/AtpI family protein [Candidatus Margulisiibacteriota bacterium]
MADMRSGLLQAASLGVEIAVAVFLGAGGGYWLDRQFRTEPWLMVVGLLLGAAAGLWNAYKIAMNNERP